MRLDKALADMGVNTRTQLKKMIRDGHVSVDGAIVRDGAAHIDPEKVQIMIDDIPVIYQKYIYFMLNKPQGVISATEGSEGTVLDLIDSPVRGLFPIGRLDKDTEGLLVISNDGVLCHALLSPRRHVEKEYEVTLRDPFSDEDIQAIESGITEGEDTFLPAVCIRTGENSCRLILKEGKYHEIKRMFLARKNEVVFLKRIRMKNLVLDESLAPGEYRELSEAELEDLKESEH